MSPLESLRLIDLSDREVLLVVADVADDDGWAYAYDVAERLGVADAYRRRAGAQRLSWLKRYGAVEREHEADEHGNLMYVAGDPHRPRYGQRWRLTATGEALASGRLRAAQQRAVDDADEAQLLLVARIVAERARASSSSAAAKLIEREWRHRWLRVNGRR
jgi:hypothetical protein